MTSIEEIPEETNGPYPADGSNGKNVLTESGVVRSDIRSSFGSSTTTAEGVPTTINFQVLDTATGQPVEGAAVYVWHCDRDGNYSMYSNGVTGENYLRGVQPTDADGMASFTSIYPACYSGRWPHVALRGVPERRRGDVGERSPGHVADRPDRRGQRGRVRHRRLRAERAQLRRACR